jgi:hypothetical protein
MTRDISDEHTKYRTALEQIARYKHTPRAYRHQKFEKLIQIAQEALTTTTDAT